MAARRHDNTPPYEIMGSTANKPQASGRGPRPGSGIGGFGRSVIDAWRDGASEPLLLRVPRGMALCLLAGFLGLLFLSYWVGHSRGWSAGEREMTAKYEPNLDGAERTPPTRTGAFQGSETTDSGVSGQVSGQRPAGVVTDQRTPGTNYLVLAIYPYDEARRLQTFLAGREVEVMLGPRNNKGLCQVITQRGFTRQQFRDTNEAEKFRTRLQAFGRDWKAANSGKGDDLSSMYYEKYDPTD